MNIRNEPSGPILDLSLVSVKISQDLKPRWKGETSRIPSIPIWLTNIPGFVPQTDRFSFRNDFYLQWHGLENINSHQLRNMRSIPSVCENRQERPNDTFKSENVLLSVHKPPWHKIHVFSLISNLGKCFLFFLFSTSIREKAYRFWMLCGFIEVHFQDLVLRSPHWLNFGIVLQSRRWWKIGGYGKPNGVSEKLCFWIPVITFHAHKCFRLGIWITGIRTVIRVV